MSKQDSLLTGWKMPLWLGRIVGMLSCQEEGEHEKTVKTGRYPNLSLRELAIRGIVEAIKAQYEKDNLPVPSHEQLRFLATERYESSVRNGPDNHLGTAAPLGDDLRPVGRSN